MAAPLIAAAITPAGASGQDEPSARIDRDAPTRALVPGTVVPARRGEAPRVIVLDAPGSPLVALRLSLPVPEGPAEAGAARIIQRLGVSRADRVGNAGADFRGERTHDGIAYTVVGAADELDHLLTLLRAAVDDPGGASLEFDRARSEVLTEMRRAEETASRQILERLRRAAAPDASSPWGTSASLEALDAADIRSVWARSHQAWRMTLVISGDVRSGALSRVLRGMGAPGDGSGRVPGAAPASGEANPPEALREWYGRAWALDDAWDPRAAVAAHLVSEHLRPLADRFESQVLLLDAGERRFLAVAGGAYPRNVSVLRATVRDAIESTAEAIDSTDVRRAVGTVRRQLLLAARTPGGRVDVVARYLDAFRASGRPRGAAGYIQALQRVDAEAMEEYFESLEDADSSVEARIEPGFELPPPSGAEP